MPQWLEKTIAALSPAAAEKREMARLRIARAHHVQALYDGATYSRRSQGWRGTLTDANAETRMGMVRLRAVARDLVRNNAYAARAVSAIRNNVVGAGITPTVRAGTDGRTKKVGSLVKTHFESTDIDADGRHNIYGLQALAMAAIVESGEVLIRKRVRNASDGYKLPFQVQVLESDFLDSNVDGALPNGNYAVQGVEFDLRGKRVAYYLFDQHPGSMTIGVSSGYRGKRVSADFVAHICRVDRPGQVRGITWFAPVVVRMKDFAEFSDAQLLRQKIAACFGIFVQTSDGAGPQLDDQGRPLPQNPAGTRIETIEPGMVNYTRDGETVTFATPPQVLDFAPYTNVTMHEISSGMGLTYECLTFDLSQTTYAGGRLGHLEMDRNVDDWRWNMLVPQMLGPIEGWTRDAVNVVTSSTEPFSLDWTPPERILIDVEVENTASKEAIRNGLSSRSEEVRKRGLDPEKLDAEIAADNERADKLKLIFDSDPRSVSGRGVSQIAPPNAGVSKPGQVDPSSQDDDVKD